jgi:hypothetical protein
MTDKKIIGMLDEIRQLAIDEKHPTAALSTVQTIMQFVRPGTERPGQVPAPPAKFDGNYGDAARRIAFLLRFPTKKQAEEAGKADGQEG